ncbi:Predicted transcriptional regulator YheO, contains PAS and DNA-binding HTH domains [Amycolatopsis saalfeldensis]|uniref:Predicted transcriptional regulator YheO, contains PAS and DNA-binding HTH domains n=2 Tax=Amycolatopsis saalfeldensis TaxID=394193 RepID=A0A1H8XXS4_9PSEU|nr:Predicted transcriptional regulator YheO, contains PAS and DNA-binding HTH domains [Amycolatopsis saalfeldensis]
MTSEPEDRELNFTTAECAHAALVVSLVGPIVPALAQALAPRTEVVLHNLTAMPNTIAAIGGAITGREVGGPPTDLGLRSFKEGQTDHWLRYSTELPDGLKMRSSSIYFHAPSGKPVACLCLNADITALHQAQEILAGLTATDMPGVEPGVAEPMETFADSIENLSEGVLSRAIEAVGVPVELMKKVHKYAVTEDLNRRGFFALRGAVDQAAHELGVSRHTIYNYLNELQGEHDGDM